MSDDGAEPSQPMSAAERKALVKALTRLLRDQERQEERMQALRERKHKQ